MPLICYQSHKFDPTSTRVIDKSVDILEEYARQGYDLTLRQLYYQFVSHDLFPDDRRWRWTGSKWIKDDGGTKNADPNYKWLGDIVNNARLAGLIDWSHITDRTRNMKENSHWGSPQSIVDACGKQYQINKWATQENYVECFTPTTPVLVGGRPTSIAALENGDMAFTHLGNMRPVLKVIRNRYRGKMLRIKATGLLPIEVTPKHPFYAQVHDPERPKDKGSRRRFLPVDWVGSQKLSKFDLIRVPLLPDLLRRSVLNRSMHAKGGSRSIGYVFPLNELALKVCGLYLAEGSVRGDGRTVQFALNATTPYADLVIEWARSVGVGYSEAFSRGTHVVYLYSKALADWFEAQFGNGAYHKVLPEWAMFALRAEQMILLEYYFRGDASLWNESSVMAASTRSAVLSQQVQLVLLWNRYACSLTTMLDHGAPIWRMTVGGESVVGLAERWNLKIPAKGLGRSGRYNYIRFIEGYALFPVRKVEEFDYDGDVWNLEVEDDHSYCVPAAVHNCWTEKDAMLGIVEVACQPLDIPYFSCRGYTSQSEMWSASQRLLEKVRAGKTVTIIHLGDHDPSGIDMSRDIEDRLVMFMRHHIAHDAVKGNPRLEGEDDDQYNRRLEGLIMSHESRFTTPVTIDRIALNMDQVEQYNPPPNPAKLTDARARGYIDRFGDESWELDALEPAVLTDLIRTAVTKLRDEEAWDKAVEREEKERSQLATVASKWGDIVKRLK